MIILCSFLNDANLDKYSLFLKADKDTELSTPYWYKQRDREGEGERYIKTHWKYTLDSTQEMTS